MKINGDYNNVIIGKDCSLTNTTVLIEGNNNTLLIDNKVRFIGPCTIRMQGNSTLSIRENSGIRGVRFLLKDANISIGKLCMFSVNITLRNNDSHKVMDLNTCTATNKAQDITLGNHVWVCENSSILKGVTIGDNSIVAFGAVVTKDCPSNSIVAGNPAKIVKTGVTWDY